MAIGDELIILGLKLNNRTRKHSAFVEGGVNIK